MKRPNWQMLACKPSTKYSTILSWFPLMAIIKGDSPLLFKVLAIFNLSSGTLSATSSFNSSTEPALTNWKKASRSIVLSMALQILKTSKIVYKDLSFVLGGMIYLRICEAKHVKYGGKSSGQILSNLNVFSR